MRKIIMLLSVGTILLGSCHKEDFKGLHNQGSSDENPKEETVRTIKDINLRNKPTKTGDIFRQVVVPQQTSVFQTPHHIVPSGIGICDGFAGL